MQTTATSRISALALLLLLPGLALQAQNVSADAALKYLRQNHQTTGLSPKSVNDLLLTSQHQSSTTGITHFYFQQQFEGIPVYNAIVSVAIAQDGRIIHVSNRAVSETLTDRRSKAQGLGAASAVASAARSLGLTLTATPQEVTNTRAARGPFKKTILSAAGLSNDEIQAQLVYLPTLDGRLRLAWMVSIATPDGDHYWNLGVDAATGQVLLQEDLTDHDNWDYDFSPFRTPLRPLAFTPRMERWAAPASQMAAGGTYRVYAAPIESPAHAGDPSQDLRTLVYNPADAAASPLGWHNDGLTAYTVTRGNNVHAYNDIDDNNLPDPGTDPDGGAGLLFDFPVNFADDPLTYQPAAVTNLFYWNNIVHDVAFRYGFTEEAGNFQTTNVSGFGLGNDYVRAEALDGSGTNNANFSTNVDGIRPRMQMYRWTSNIIVTVNAPSPIAGDYDARGAAFGPPLTPAGFTGDVELANDGAGFSNTDACEPLVGFTPGKIALIDRGSCTFVLKVKNAQDAGAVAVVMANNVAGSPITMGGADPTIVIPSAMISLDAADLFKLNLPLNTTLRKDGFDRDSDFDSGIIVHEYGHGISNRLTGGPNVVGCLSNAEQMGEGWSDYYALLLTDSNTDDRGIGTYAIFEPTTGPGIRPYPYSTNFAVNPATYATINDPSISQPHGVGFVWATMLWGMTRDLVNRYGFDPDIYGGTGGNNVSLILVTEGLKMQPCGPGFVDGRDAILAADNALTGGANQCLIWDAFARRGLGFSADQGLTTSRFDAVEAFDLPVSCSTFAMAIEMVEALQASGALNQGQANSLLQKLRNAERQAAKGQTGAALNLLGAFVNEVTALVKSKTLTAQQGQDLIALAQGIMHRLQENDPSSGKNAIAQAEGAVPEAFALDANYPNPFAGQTTIRYALPEAAHVRLSIYDVMGREVARLVDGERAAGFYEQAFDGNVLPSGVYLYRIEAGTHVAVRQMTLVR